MHDIERLTLTSPGRAGGGGRIRALARGAGAFAPGEREHQNHDDEHGGCDPPPRDGGCALHFGLAFHVHSTIEVSGIGHGWTSMCDVRGEITREGTATFPPRPPGLLIAATQGRGERAWFSDADPALCSPPGAAPSRLRFCHRHIGFDRVGNETILVC